MHYRTEKTLILLILLCLNLKSNEEVLQSVNSDVNVDNFNVDDIFNSDLIMIDQMYFILNDNQTEKENLLINTTEYKRFHSIDLNSAIKAMGYHRNMMNKYLLSGYLSKAIIKSASNATIERRLGRASNDLYVDIDKSNELPKNHKLLDDEGSSKYSTWLKRMATLEDIQKHFHKKNAKSVNRKNIMSADRRQSMNINFDPMDGDDVLETTEDGDITGYAYANTPNDILSFQNLYKNHQGTQPGEKLLNVYKPGISKTGYDNGYDDYTSPPHLPATSPSKQTKEIGLKDITDIALTTLAFLSFGMFILQVLMCITMSKDDTSNMVMLPMEGTDNGEIPGDDNIDEIRRKRRSIFPTQLRNIEMINQLAKRALFSLNAVTYVSKDDGVCYYYSLCENNKYSRSLPDIKKLWIPVWSLGISWLTMKLNNFIRTSSKGKINPVVDSLKAIMIGLNNGNCSLYYQNKC